jgi:GABA permease
MGAAAKDLTLKMWFFPYLTWLAIGSIVALIIGMVILDTTRESLLLSVALAAVVVGIGVWRYRKGGPGRAAVPATSETSPETAEASVGSGPAS